MKKIARITLPLISLLITLGVTPQIAMADGGYHESGGCEGDGLLWLIGIIFVIMISFVIYDAVMMKVSPAYRARSEQIKRELEARRRY